MISCGRTVKVRVGVTGRVEGGGLRTHAPPFLPPFLQLHFIISVALENSRKGQVLKHTLAVPATFGHTIQDTGSCAANRQYIVLCAERAMGGQRSSQATSSQPKP